MRKFVKSSIFVPMQLGQLNKIGWISELQWIVPINIKKKIKKKIKLINELLIH